ncbi:hypothetical protein GCM10027347_59220 [Larkinella harenae]
MDDFERLIHDLESRKARDQAKRNAWYVKAVDDLKSEIERDKHDLMSRGIGYQELYRQKLSDIERQREEKKIADEARHRQIDQDIIDEKTTKVWIEADQEKRYVKAKKVWDHVVQDALERTGEPPSKGILAEMKKEYGPEIYQQLVEDTRKGIEDREKREQQLDQERSVRYADYQKKQAELKIQKEREEAERLERQKKEKTQSRKRRFGWNAEQIENTDWQDRHKSHEQRYDDVRRKMERDEIERLKQKKINPVDQSYEKMQQQILDEQERQRILHKQKYDRIFEEGQRRKQQREKEAAEREQQRQFLEQLLGRNPSPVETTEDRYNQLIQKYKDRNNGHEW